MRVVSVYISIIYKKMLYLFIPTQCINIFKNKNLLRINTEYQVG